MTDKEEFDREIIIPSASGREQISMRLSEPGLNRDQISANLVLKGKFWRHEPESLGELDDEYVIAIHQATLSAGQLGKLLRSLDTWFSSYQEISINLSADVYQKALLGIGSSSELMTQKDKPALSFFFKGRSMIEARVEFLVDQSCIQQFVDSLRQSSLRIKLTH